MKNDVFEAKSSQDGSWGDLGSILVAKRGRLGALKRPQVDQNEDRKSINFLIDFGPIFVRPCGGLGEILGRLGVNLGPFLGVIWERLGAWVGPSGSQDRL